MAEHTVTFDKADRPVTVKTGTLLTEAAQAAGLDLMQPCGGQGRCGRCVVRVTEGKVRPRSELRLSPEDIATGLVLACQAVVEGDVAVAVPEQEKIERKLTTDRTVADVAPPEGYDSHRQQTIRRLALTLAPPRMDDQTDDWSRLCRALRQEGDLDQITASLETLRQIGGVLRRGEWEVTATVETSAWDRPEGPARLIDLVEGRTAYDEPIWGVAVDIGTTTVSVWLVDLITGEVRQQAAEYNGQIARGEDVISRIVYAGKSDENRREMRDRVVKTVNDLVARVCERVSAESSEIVKATIAGNSTMIHLLLGLEADSIRQSPFVTTVNHPPLLTARQMGLSLHPEAGVDCLPGVASYVGADISAGVLSAGLNDSDQVTLFLDVGTNGETVLGSAEWLVTCACSAGPAFEGAGVMHGMRATRGAIDEVWINADTWEPTWRVIGNVKPSGLCGSGLISLLAELFLTGVIDKSGNIQVERETPRTREGDHGPEYIIARAQETETGKPITITRIDIDNLLRAKAAIYAGFSVLADSVGVPLEMVEQVLIGGSFGKYINIEKAIEIGLLPDMPWDRFRFLGNTSVKGAYLALLDRDLRTHIREIAARMTYIELSADNTFYEAFMSAMFLPHTDIARFPTVEAAMLNKG